MKETKKLIKPEAVIIVFPIEEIIATSSGGNNPMSQFGEDDPEEVNP